MSIDHTPTLEAIKLSRHFAGLKAVDKVSLRLMPSTIHALIGTNGAGKSTLINLLSGEIPATNGDILLRGASVSSMSQSTRARQGVGRTYQRTTVFPSFTVRENCRLAAQAHFQRKWDWLHLASECKDTLPIANDAIERVGLTEMANVLVEKLSHGQKRQLEIAMCLATQPYVLLLDEPLAGMGAEETDRVLDLLVKLREDHAILLVEHDMDAVFRIADEITVMVNGTVIATGTPSGIRDNREVQVAYLGVDDPGELA